MSLDIKPASACRWDAISLGEVMLRFDPEWGRVRTTRHFRVSEGGGEYNVARALTQGLRHAHRGRHRPRRQRDRAPRRGPDDDRAASTSASSSGCRTTASGSKRGWASTSWRRASASVRPWASPTVPTPPSRSCKPGDIDWERDLREDGVRWMHTGGIFAALSDSPPPRSPSRPCRRPRRAAPSSPTTSTTAPRCGSRAAGRSVPWRSTASWPGTSTS